MFKKALIASSNLDGKIDVITVFDRKGIIKSSSADEDFNGTFETDVYYDDGNAVWQKSDTTGDDFKDYQVSFKHGIAETITFQDPNTKGVLKIQEFGPHKLRRAKLDTTGDGVLDTVYEYDSIEEVSKRLTGQ